MGFHGFNKIIWSPVEVEFLQKHRHDMSREQLTIALSKSLNAIKNKLLELDGKGKPSKIKKTKQGRRKDLKTYFRSSWEANVARWLNHQGIKWVYEPKVFFFDGVRTGTNTYCPDFYLPDLDIWLEVKGQMIPSARAAIRRFKQYFPAEFKKLKAITGSSSTGATQFFNNKKVDVPIWTYYNEIDKKFKNEIPNWE
jgi:hypothetical protein